MPYKDPKKIAGYQAAYRAAHREELRLYSKLRHKAMQAERIESVRLWRLANPEKYAAQLRRKTSKSAWQKRMTPVEYQTLLANQQNCCDLCGEPFTEKNPPASDHCHATNRNRGLLHAPCNCAIGLLKDSPRRCIQAAKYLRKWKRLHAR